MFICAEIQLKDCQLPYPVSGAWPLTLPGFPSILSSPELASVLSSVCCVHSPVFLQAAGLASIVGTMPYVLTSLGLQKNLLHLSSEMLP